MAESTRSKRKHDDQSDTPASLKSDSRVSKKIRNDSDPVESNNAAVSALSPYRNVMKDGDIWFEDGNVVFVTIPESVAFRVHGGLLSPRSEVLAAMISASSNSTKDGLYEGAFVLPVDDNEVAFRLFLRAIYDGSQTYLQPTHHQAQLVLSQVLRLAHKYQVPDLRARVVAVLSASLPFTLVGWDRREAEKDRKPKEGSRHWEYLRAQDIIKLARETEARLLLPAAFLLCSRIYWNYSTEYEMPSMCMVPKWIAGMERDDLQAFFFFQDALQHASLSFTHQFCYNRSCSQDGGTKTTECSQGFASLSTFFLEKPLLTTGSPAKNPFYIMSNALQFVEKSTDICSPCRCTFVKDVKQERQRLWDTLPALLGLPIWEEMREQEGILFLE